MARQHSLGARFESGGSYWAFLGLLFGCSLFFFSGVQRFTLLALAPMLLLASLIIWLRPRWERSLTLGVGSLLVLLFSFVLWHSGPSVFVFGFLTLGIWEIVRSVFLWKNEPEDAEETNDEEESNNPQKHRKKRQRIAHLLAGGDDDELFSRVFDRIVRRYGGDLDVGDLQEHERVFLLAYDAWGILVVCHRSNLG